MHDLNKKRAVVTGLGVISSIGETAPQFAEGLFAGRCGIGPVTLFDTTGFFSRQAGQIRSENLARGFTPRELKRVSRCDLLGLIAAREAVADAALVIEEADRYRAGVVLGGGAGGMLSWEKYRRTAWEGKRRPRPSLILAASPGTLTDLIANRWRLNGMRSTISTACSSSGTAIGYAADLIRSGKQDVVITGGSEALSELTFAGFNALRVTDPEPCRPFDKHRRGLSLGEGAAIFVLEAYERARQRQARIYAEILGYAINSDAYHLTAPDPEARGMTDVMARALANAGITAAQVDYINAHGTATPLNDKMESRAIHNVFGPRQTRRLAVSSTKSMVGHCLGASGAVEAAATLLALARQILPPTVNCETPDPECDLDTVPHCARPNPMTTALSNSFAFGGNNTSLVLAAPER